MDKIWKLGSGGLAIHHHHAEIVKVVKSCNAFPIHRLGDTEIWHTWWALVHSRS